MIHASKRLNASYGCLHIGGCMFMYMRLVYVLCECTYAVCIRVSVHAHVCIY